MLWGTGSSTKPALGGLGTGKRGNPSPQQGRDTGRVQDRQGTKVLWPRRAGRVAAAGAWLPARLGSPRALPALRSLSAFPRLRAPPFLTAPSRQPPPARPRPCSCRRFVSFGTRLSAFVPPSAPAPTSPGTRRASAQPSPRQRRGKAQAAAGYLPTASPGASRNGAPGNGDAGGEQRPQLPAAAWCVGMKRDLPGEGTAGTGSRDGGDVSPGSTAGGRAVGRGGTSMGDIVPVAQRAPLASKPNLQSVALSHSSPDTLQGAVPRARALPAAPPAPQQDVAALGSPPPARSRF